jgi:hypothetical protein
MKRNVKKNNTGKTSIKKNAEEIHAKRRFKQRLGEELPNSDYKKCVALIKNNKCNFVGRYSLRVSYWTTTINGKEVKIVYDNNRHRIVTFMPPDFKTKVRRL